MTAVPTYGNGALCRDAAAARPLIDEWVRSPRDCWVVCRVSFVVITPIDVSFRFAETARRHARPATHRRTSHRIAAAAAAASLSTTTTTAAAISATVAWPPTTTFSAAVVVAARSRHGRRSRHKPRQSPTDDDDNAFVRTRRCRRWQPTIER